MIGYLGKHLLKFVQRFEKVLERMKSSKLFPAFSFIKRYLGCWLASTFIIAMVLMAMDIVRFISAWRKEELYRPCVERWVAKTAYRVLNMVPFGMFLFLGAVGFGFTSFLTISSLFEKSYTYSRLRTLRTIKPGDVITFNLFMPFSFHDAVVVQSVKTFTTGNMQSLQKHHSTISEIFEQSQSMLNDFFRDTSEEKYRSFRYLRMYVKNTDRGIEAVPVDAFQEHSMTHTLKRQDDEWIFTSDVDVKEEIPRVCFLCDDKKYKILP
ncbi:uncharacterized protein LOC125676776 [Ostrea edulis]|uniref:uncharacterized protein LOC125676776 n=1 Tax=Ostrea edulis TaxID=37623 RepID=UPI0024AF743A|nr:uncharacterized protein LOC125676776 [Ostrea edulis]